MKPSIAGGGFEATGEAMANGTNVQGQRERLASSEACFSLHRNLIAVVRRATLHADKLNATEEPAAFQHSNESHARPIGGQLYDDDESSLRTPLTAMDLHVFRVCAW